MESPGNITQTEDAAQRTVENNTNFESQDVMNKNSTDKSVASLVEPTEGIDSTDQIAHKRKFDLVVARNDDMAHNGSKRHRLETSDETKLAGGVQREKRIEAATIADKFDAYYKRLCEQLRRSAERPVAQAVYAEMIANDKRVSPLMAKQFLDVIRAGSAVQAEKREEIKWAFQLGHAIRDIELARQQEKARLENSSGPRDERVWKTSQMTREVFFDTYLKSSLSLSFSTAEKHCRFYDCCLEYPRALLLYCSYEKLLDNVPAIRQRLARQPQDLRLWQAKLAPAQA